ncbi:uncharacterized protein LTR77_010911 [Saxophila tyrrhenica]|uniref:xylan 1,4-beta-xylosidase n=1 Tax=Saxophila tyrrhenica TaxID=1690608 RepID=A0AAV9NWP6_9PEZI|nr:hypothetical protein LTR77_010911 [Saxophila tyrrhenica]
MLTFQKAAVLGSALLTAASITQGDFVCTGSGNITEYHAQIKNMGCWIDSMARTLSGKFSRSSTNSPQSCADNCGNMGYKYFGLEDTSQCFCGNNINPMAQKTNGKDCDDTCPGDPSKSCGGTDFMNLYSIENPNPNAPPPTTKRQPVCKTNPFCSFKACNTSLSMDERIAALLKEMTLEEKVTNLVDSATGVPRLGLPPYEWWSEALHGVADSPGVEFNSPNGSDFSYATSFPMPILMGAAFDDPLIYDVASTIGKEARAFGNYEQSGFDFWTPNINTFLDPRWGRGLEVPTEDSFHAQSYVKNLIPGLQGGLDSPEVKQVIATCKHYAVYDVETNRNGQNYDPTQQDLGEYYLQPFKTCVRDVAVGSIMCSYNAVDGVPSCANEYLLQTVLREDYGFGVEPYRYITSDCAAVENIYDPHNFTDSMAAAAAVALNAGTDTNCGTGYLSLNVSVAKGWTTEAQMDVSLTRLYNALFTVGYFDGQPEYDSLSFADVSTGSAQALAYQAAWEGMTLLKNDDTLPLSKSNMRVAMIGPWTNATTQMQGNYEGIAPYLISPLRAAQEQWGRSNVHYVNGTGINSTSKAGFAAAISAANAADVVIYLGGIDTSIEAEGMDRTSIDWPGNQLDLVSRLSNLGKPLVVVQFGGGQIDDSQLLKNKNVNSLVWAGYPGQDGGHALIDTLVGKKAPAGRLTTTQYPADYIDEVCLFDPNLRPSGSSPGRTYKWYNQDPVLPFGYGLHYTTWSNFQWTATPKKSYEISSLVSEGANDASPFTTVKTSLENTGDMASDYVGLLFVSTANAGPEPYPNKALVSYTRAHDIAPGSSQTLSMDVNLGALARANKQGDLVIYPGDYEFMLDIDSKLHFKTCLTGDAVVLETLPRQAASYNFTTEVHPTNGNGPETCL